MNADIDNTSPNKARVLVFTGDGKGKTTAAMGMALRAAAHGMPVRIIQFLKNDASTGELSAFRLFPHVEMQQVGKGFVPKPTHPRFHEHCEAVEAGLTLARDALRSGAFKAVILDEICTATQLKLCTTSDVTELIQYAQEGTILALTGRGAPQSLIELADTVTNMQCIKHGMDNGRIAQAGVEF
jgi:cob(I)alamin adenosyltransferase